MNYMSNPGYSLRYDRKGREKEKNRISPLLTAESYSIDEVNEIIRPQFQTMREVIRISRKRRYDLDISTSFGMLDIAIYRRASGYINLAPLMPVFAEAFSVGMERIYFGRVLVLNAFYLFLPEK